ncbi:BTAD domain-containing putative transcriptional regulator [Actinoplanes sp. CA-051413]|uniref:AfsR/SARP family transcriptional regulator n=1 Tax=Actinoplanes sp. CA-051413 TaxID=3239899 RepID=UPI003D991105
MKLVLLGPVGVVVEGRPVHIERAQRRAVLAYLLLHPNQTVTTDQLIDALWGAAPPATAKRQIFAAVSAVRRALRTAGREPVTSAGGGYRATVTAAELDLLAFTEHRDRGQQLARAGELTRAVAALRSGLGLWSGTPLGGVSGAFVDQARHQLEDQRLAALETLFDTENELGNHHAVVDDLAALAAAHPFRERLAGALMLALYRSGRPAEALATYRRLRQTLSGELGIDPGPPVTELHDRILRNDDALRTPAAAREAGSGAARHFLPHDIPDFTGRSAELAGLDALLTATPGGTDVVIVSAVVGVGGVGKTALAVHWAHRIAARFPDGQLYLDLRGYDERRPLPAAEALGVMLRTLGVPPRQIPADVDEAAALYRATIAGHRVLILLDNAASAAQVRPILPATPGTLVLVTSRDALGGLIARDGARRVEVGLLSPGDAVELLARILGVERVAGEAQATDDLIRACGFLPLALRIAAANLAARPRTRIAAYVRELLGGRRLDALLVDGDPQSSLRTIFDQSYRRLGPATQRAFRLLGSAPVPDLTAAAAAQLLGRTAGQAQAALRALADAHLVAEHRPGRFTMHDLVREYARHRAGPADLREERAAALARVLSWFVTGAETAAARHNPARIRLPPTGPFPPFATAEEAARWLTAELPNLVAVVETGTALGHPDAVWRLVFAGQPFLNATIERATMLSLGRAALAAAELSTDPRARPAAELAMAHSYTTNGYDSLGMPHAERCLELARQSGWRELEPEAHNALSVYHLLGGDLRSAAEHARSAFDGSMALGVEPPQYLGKVALIEMLMGSLAEASDHFERTLASPGHRAGYSRAITLLNLAEVRTLQGRPVQADQLLVEALALLAEAGNAHVTALARADLAVIRYASGQRTEAWDLLDQARSVLAASTDVLARTQLAGRHADLLLAADRPADATEILEPALAEAEPYGNHYPTTQTLITLARACAPADLDRAADFAARAVDAARKGQFRLLEGRALNEVARVHLLAGRRAEAREAADAARRIHEATGHEPGLREAHRLLAETVSG